MYRYRITDAARQDMKRIAAYIADELYAPESARRLMEQLRDAFRHACAYPQSLPPVKDDLFHALGYRKIIVEHYIAFVLIDAEQETVYVARVLYCGQDYRAIL